MKRLTCLVLVLICFVGVIKAQDATDTAKVLISEFTPNPDTVEIFNNTTEIVQLGGWRLDDNGGTTFYTLPEMILQPGECAVISANINLNDATSDTVQLFNKDGEKLIDSYLYDKPVVTGNNTYQRSLIDGSWTIGTSNFGQNNQTKQSCLPVPSPTPSPTATPSPTPTTIYVPTSTPTPIIEDIYISEVMAYPDSGANEWVELYNNNDHTVSLSGWYIDDGEGTGASPRSFSLDIEAHKYGVVELNSGIFNNDGDQVRLLNPNKLEVDKISYLKSTKGYSWGRTSWGNENVCQQAPSKQEINSGCINLTTPEPTIKSTKTVKDTSTNAAKTTPPKQSESQIESQSNTTLGEVLGINDEEDNWSHLIDDPILTTQSSAAENKSEDEMIVVPNQDINSGTMAQKQISLTWLTLGGGLGISAIASVIWKRWYQAKYHP